MTFQAFALRDIKMAAQEDCRARPRPCKIRTGILAGSRRDPGKILAGERNSRRPKSRRDRALNLAKILAGKQKSQQPKSRRDPATNLAKILAGKQKSRQPKSRRDPATNLAKILAGKQKFRQPKSRRDPAVNLAKILAEKQKSRRPKSRRNPATKLTKILAGKQIDGGKNLGAILPGISPRLATGSEILGEIYCGNLVTNFFWIEPNVYVLEIS